MGYSYCFSLSTTEKLSKEQFLRVKQAYKNVKGRDWFPTFGETVVSTSSGYGTGSTAISSYEEQSNEGIGERGVSEAERWGEEDNPISELLLFTSQVPDVTFMVIYTFWDETNIKVYKIKDTTVLNIWHKSSEDDGLGIYGFKVSFSMTNVRGDNSLDEYLRDNVEYE